MMSIFLRSKSLFFIIYMRAEAQEKAQGRKKALTLGAPMQHPLLPHGRVAKRSKAVVCKTTIHRFESGRGLR